MRTYRGTPVEDASLCPKCAGETKVLSTRYLNIMTRYRVCLECGNKHQTYEVDSALLDQVIAQEKQLKAMRVHLQTLIAALPESVLVMEKD
jgi:transcriptional regulator NrdR family protein